MIVTLLLASVVVVGVMQLVFAFVAALEEFYSPPVRAGAIVFLLFSSLGAFGFVYSVLTGRETLLLAATLYQVCQAGALSLIVAWRVHDNIRNRRRS